MGRNLLKTVCALLLLMGGINNNILAQSYCESKSNFVDPGAEHISLVEYGSVSNSSLATAYTDFSTITTEIPLGGSMDILVKVPFWYDDAVVVFVDWNQNFELEQSEKTILDHAEFNSPDFRGVVQIPSDAKPGKTRMRIIVEGADIDIIPADVTSCGITAYGETEDYSVSVTNTLVESAFIVNKTAGGIGETFTFTSEAIGNPDTFEWNFGDGATPATADGIGPYEVSYNTRGFKDISLKVSNASNEDIEEKTSLVEVIVGTSAFEKPHHPYAQVACNNVNLHWYAPGEDPEMNSPEDFESGIFPPAGWDVMTSETIADAPIIAEDQYSTWKTWGEEPFLKDGKYSAMILLMEEDCNWLVSPKVKILADQELEFDIYFANGQESSKFDLMILDDGVWKNGLSYDENTANNLFEDKVTVDLAAYASKEIRIAFVQTYTNGFNIALDNILIKGPEKSANKKEVTSTVTAYKVYRNANLIAELEADKRAYADNKLLPGSYNYTINAVYAAGESFETAKVPVITTAAHIDLATNHDIATIGQDVIYTLDIIGTADNIQINFGENANPATAEGAGPHTVQYTGLGKKTISIEANGVHNSSFENKVLIYPGSANIPKPEMITAKADFNSVNLSWRPNDVICKLKESFESESFPPATWQVKYSGSIDGAQKTVPLGMASWFKNDEDSFSGNGQKFTHWGKQSAAIPFDVVGCQWMITPTVEVEANDQLRFFLYYKNGEIGSAYYHTQFHVMVKENLEWEEVFYLGAGANPNFYEDEIIIDLSAYDGQDVHIAFVYEHSYGFELAIDDITVINPSQAQGNLAGLNIYRDDVKIYSTEDIKEVSYVDENLETGEYKYYVTATDAANKESFPSNEYFVQSYKVYDLPYTQDFDGSYSEIEFSNMDRPWKVGDSDFFTNGSYHFPSNDGSFAGINCAEDGHKIVSDYMVLSPINLKSYWDAYLEFDYVNEIHEFTLVGRAGISGPWTTICKIDPTTEWTHKKINLPNTMRQESYQFAFFASNASIEKKGVAIDNIHIGFTPGKTIKLVYQNNFLESESTTLLGSSNSNEAQEYIIQIENVNTEDFEIQSVSLNNSAFTLLENPAGQILSQGDTKDIKIQFIATEEKEYSVDLNVKSNADNTDYTIHLKAIIGKVDWTYMIYLYEDHTGLDGSLDINELEVNGSIPGKVNYVILYDADNDTKDGIYYVEKDEDGMNYQIKSRLISTIFNTDLDMNDYKTLENYMVWVKENFPAKHYGLNVWDHGSGIFKKSQDHNWKAACGEMKMWDMAKAVKTFKDVDGQGLDILGFDVCLAGQVETVYDFKDLTKVVVASEKTEPGSGWEYTTQFAPLNANPKINAYTLAYNFVNAYAESYRPDGSQTNTETGEAVTLSAIRTDHFKDDFIPALNLFSEKMIANMNEIKPAVNAARNATWYSDGDSYKQHRDLGHFLKLLKTKSLPEDVKLSCENLLTAYNKAVFNSQENLCPKASGLKIWMPANIKAEMMQIFYCVPQNALKISETSWDEYLRSFGDPQIAGKLTPKMIVLGSKEILVNDSIQFICTSFANPIISTRNWEFTPNTVNFVNGTDIHSASPNVQFTAEGKYTLNYTITNASGEETKTFTEEIIVRKGFFNTPGHLYYNYKQETKTVTLIWTKPEAGYDGTLKGYRIFRDGEAIHTIDSPEENIFYDELSEAADHEYYVVAIYVNPNGVSDPSNIVLVKPTELNEINDSNLQVFPNPSQGLIHILNASTAKGNWSLVDMQGNTLNNGQLNSSQTDLEIKQPGVYFLKIQSQNKTAIRKIVIQ